MPRSVEAAPAVAAALVGTIGLVIFAGWVIGARVLIVGFDGLPTTKVNVALAFMLAAVSLRLLRAPTPARRRGAALASSALVLFGTLTLIEWIFGVPLGMDQLLRRDPALLGVAGRASPQVATAFLLFGLTQLTLDSTDAPKRRLHGFAALGFAFVVGSVALGYLYGSSVLTGTKHVTGVSPLTALGLVALLVAVACERPSREPIRWLWSPGHAGAAARRLAAGAVVGAPALGLLRLLGQEAGLYDVRFGLALLVGSMIVMFLALATSTARAIHHGEKLQHELRAIFDNVPAPLAMRDRDGRYLNANPYFTRSMGLSLEQLAGTYPEDHYPEQAAATIRAQDEELLRSREPVTYEVTVPHGDGSDRDYYVVKYPVLDDSGDVEGFGSFSLDITERKRAEARLQEAEERFRGTFEEAPIGITLVAPDGCFLRANAALCEIVGYSEQELLELTFQDITHPDDLDADLENVRQMLAGEIRTYQMQKRYFHKQGRIIWVRLSVSLVRDSAGSPLHFVSQIEDITAGKQADESLREAQARLQSIFDHIPAGLALRGLDGRYLHVNRYVADSLGCTPEELVGRDPEEHLDEATRARIRAEDAEMCRTRKPVVQEFSVPHVDGTNHDYHVVRYPVIDTRGAVTAFGSFTLDVTERKRAESALARERDYAETITRSMREGFVLTRDGVILEVNGALCQLTGFSREELVGAREPFPFWAPEATEELVRMRDRMIEQEGGEFEAVFTRKDGTRFQASFTAVPAHGPDDALLGYVTTIRDISQQKLNEAELKRLARHDPLTGLANWRVFHEELRAEVARARRHGRSLSLAILDLDHFKQVNDQYGHPVGDRVLAEVAKRLTALVREGELLARVGGEEFAWLLPDAGAIGAYAAAERARQAIAATHFPEVGTLTLSAGVCELNDAENAQELYAHADEALYWAKQHGRNETFRYTEQSARELSRPA